MELTHEFRVSVPIDQAWNALTDLERIAPCMPGAQLVEVEGDEYRGVVKVKVGPITAQYSGVACMLEKDDAAHKAVLKAEGRETRGQGNASATVTATLREDGDGTAVAILTDLSITGKVAQFGRGLIADVSGKLLDQFVAQLEENVLSGGDASSEPSGSGAEARPAPDPVKEDSDTAVATEGTIRSITSEPVEPVDLFETAGSSIVKRAVPAAVLGLLALIFWRRKRR